MYVCEHERKIDPDNDNGYIPEKENLIKRNKSGSVLLSQFFEKNDENRFILLCLCSFFTLKGVYVSWKKEKKKSEESKLRKKREYVVAGRCK